MVTVSVGVASSRGSKGLARSRISDSPILTLILTEGNGSGACLLGVGGTPVSAAGENPGATRERSAVRPAPPHDPRNSTLAPGVVYTRSRTLYTRGHPPRLLSAVRTPVCSGAPGVGCHPAPRAPRPCPGARRRPPSGVLRFQVGTAGLGPCALPCEDTARVDRLPGEGMSPARWGVGVCHLVGNRPADLGSGRTPTCERPGLP